MDHPLYGGELMAKNRRNPEGAARKKEERQKTKRIENKKIENKKAKKDKVAKRADKIEAKKQLNTAVKEAGKDGRITSKEVKQIAGNTRFNLDKIGSAIGKSNANYNTENLNLNINRGRLTPEQFDAEKNTLIKQFTNQSIKKDPYTGEVRPGPLKRTALKLQDYGVTDFQPKPIQLEMAKLAQSGESLTNKTLQDLASQLNRDKSFKFTTKPQAIVNAANMFGLTGKGNVPLTADNVRKQFASARAVETEAPVNQVDTAENAALDIEKIIKEMTTTVMQGFQNQPDIGALLKGVTDSQNAMFGNMANNNRIQQSQMNPIRMAPVLGVRSAGMQNYGVNNATNTFGRLGNRVQGIKNNSLNLT